MLALTKELPFSEHSGAWGSWFSPSGVERGTRMLQPRKALGGHSIFNRGREAEGRLPGACCGSGRGRGMGQGGVGR